MLTVTSAIEFNPEDEVCREPAVEIGQRIIRFQSIDDVTVRESGEAVEFDVAVTVRAADEIVPTACRVHQRACGKLKRISSVTARIGEVVQCLCIQIRGCVWIFRVDEWSCATYFNRLVGMSHLQRVVDRLILS